MNDNIQTSSNVMAFARRTDPGTSWEAARETTKRLRKLHKEVLQFAFERGARGFTDVDLGEFFDCQGSTYRTRRSELTARGYITDTGARIGSKGRRHIVWAITAEGGHALIYGVDPSSPPPLAA